MLKYDGEVYNLGSRTATSTMELAQIILNCVGKTNSEVVHVADRPGHDLLYAVDPSRAESLGWSPLHDPVSAIADTVRWYVKHEDWWRQARASEHFQTHLRAWYIERQA